MVVWSPRGVDHTTDQSIASQLALPPCPLDEEPVGIVDEPFAPASSVAYVELGTSVVLVGDVYWTRDSPSTISDKVEPKVGCARAVRPSRYVEVGIVAVSTLILQAGTEACRRRLVSRSASVALLVGSTPTELLKAVAVVLAVPTTYAVTSAVCMLVELPLPTA